MSMFCFQCQETAKNEGCVVKGVCGKDEDTSNLMDVLVYSLKGLSRLLRRRGQGAGANSLGASDFDDHAAFIYRGLFATITNANFDSDRIVDLVLESAERRRNLLEGLAAEGLTEMETWMPVGRAQMYARFAESSVLAEEDPDVRSFKEFSIYGVKGLAAYADHAEVLGYRDPELNREVVEILAATTDDLSGDELPGLLVRAGNACVKGMALLDKANTETYGHPEITKVNIGVGDRPGILISGHDLRDLSDLLEQTKGTGVDVYTHGEMLPAHYYPAFKKYDNLVGNYGGSWWKQGSEFDTFNGAILMTTNCIIPVKAAYVDRIFTTGMTGYPDVPHIPDRLDGKPKDFTAVIERARQCAPPQEIETGEIVGGFAHNQVEELGDKVLSAVQSGAIKRFVVMGGCDGRHRSREYFTQVAQALPKEAVILTSGCAKYRYNKLELGDIDGIPRVLDAGQCNDSYSLAVIAMRLAELAGAEDVNQLPLDFDIAWYEQKAVCVLMGLLALGFKGVRIGPTLPAFVSEGVKQLVVETFGLKVSSTVEEDVAAIMA
jgi:hydroxylamine reductase